MKKFAVSLLLCSLLFSMAGEAALAQTVGKKLPTKSAVPNTSPSLPSLAEPVLAPEPAIKTTDTADLKILDPVAPVEDNNSVLPEAAPAAALGIGDNQVIEEEPPVRDPAEPEEEVLAGQNPNKSQYNFLKNFTGSFSTDLFTGAATFQYPLWTPAGRLGMTPAISLSYSTNDSRFDSLAGYGWSFPANAIYRSTRRGSDQLFSRNDFTADINGNSQELIILDEDAGLYGAKIESGFTKYEFSDNQWIATDGRGTHYIFGASAETRQADPDDDSRVYKWLLERVEDLNGNFISYSYFHDRGQVYPAAIRYTGHGQEPGIFEIRFVRQERPAVVSYERGFKTETRFLIGQIGIYSYQAGQAAEVLSYSFNHEARNNAIRLLSRIEVRSARDNSALPPISFSYYNGGEDEPLKKINYLKEINFPYGARQEFFYKPSTAQRLNNGSLASKLPFTVFTLKESRLYPAPGAEAQITRYEYEGGHYYFDRLDAYKKEYAGFHLVGVVDPAGNVRKTYFHQSEFSADNEGSAQQGEFQDHIAKKGRIYREEQYNDAGRLFQKTIRQWDKSALPDDNAEAERFFVFLRQETAVDYDGDDDAKARASSYQYDVYGNVRQQTDFGEVNLLNDRGGFQDASEDRTETSIEYALNAGRHIVSLPSRSVKRDFLANIAGEEKVYYDGLNPGQAVRGNETRRQTRVLADGGDPDLIWAVSQKEYDDYGLPIRSVNPRGFAVSAVYDQWHLYPASSANALGHLTTFAYDPVFGIPVLTVDPNGGRQTAALDGLGRKTSQSVSSPVDGAADVLTISYAYQLENYPRSIETVRHFAPNALAVEQRVYLDGLGREIQTRSKMEEANQYSVANKFYDARGNLVKETLPVFGFGSGFSAPNFNAVGNLYSYDALNRVVSVTNPLGETRTVYDQWEQTIVDPNGNRKDLVFDASGRLAEVREYLDNVAYATSYKYDSNGNLIKITNAKSEIANFNYDLAGRKIRGEDFHQPADQSFAVWQYVYDQNGNNVLLIKPDGEEISFAYDGLDRILSENNRISYVYDRGDNGISRLASVSFPGGNKSFEYDKLGRIVRQVLAVGEGEEAENFTLGYSYDIQGNVLAADYPNGVRVRNAYNNGGLLEAVFVHEPDQEERAVIAGTKYLPNGFVGTRDFANGISASDEYPVNQMYRLARRTARRLADGVLLQNIAYEYDAVGNITRIVDSSATNAAKTANYQYDDLYRLTRAEVANAANNENYVQTFGYDITGNILNFSPQGHPYEYAGANAAGNENFASPQAVTNIGDLAFAYDRNGNLVEQKELAGKWDHAWDWKDRLVSSIHSVPDPLEEWRNDQEIRYSYDEQKQRILKNDVTNGEITVYVDKYFDKEGDVEKVYIYAGDVRIASLESEAGLVFHNTDHLTGANVDTNQDGQILQLLDYFPYGSIRIDEAEGEYHDDYGFTGKELDEETNLNYFEARYYDSAIGRFISRDTWDGDLKDPQSLNKYAYARNNPLKYTDPQGEFPVIPLLLAAYVGYQFYRNGPGAAAEAAPFTGDLNDFYSAATGRSLYTGKSVSMADRFLGAAAAFIPAVTGGELKAGKKVVEEGVERIGKAKEIIQKEIKELKFLNGGRNSIEVDTVDQKIRYDLEGKSHFDKSTQENIPTPHVQTNQKNFKPDNDSEYNLSNSEIRPMNRSDIRNLHNILERRLRNRF